MEGLLTAVKTVKRDSDALVTPAAEPLRADLPARNNFDPEHVSSRHIIDLLKSSPDREQLSAILAALDPFSKSKVTKDFDLRVASPITAQILQILVSTTIPDHWGSLDARDSKGKDAKARAALLRCLSSVAGLGSLVAQLRSLINAARASAQQPQGSSSQLGIQDLLTVLAALLEPRDFLFRLSSDISAIYNNKTRQQVTWRELVSLVAAGKILSTAAEAFTVVDESKSVSSISWVVNGSQYASWLGHNISHMAARLAPDNESDWTSVALLTGRALSLGYTDQVVKEIYSGLLLGQSSPACFGTLLNHLRRTEQLAFVEAIFRDIQIKHFSDDLSGAVSQAIIPSERIEEVAALISAVISSHPDLETQVMEWLSKSQGGSINTLGLRRALLATFSNRGDMLKSLLIRSLEQFGDKFSIKHVPNVVQNATAQVILLAAGHLYRLDQAQVKEVGRSGAYLNAVSNRLAASSNRARLLGMLVGTGISELIEQPDKVLKFDLEEMRSEEALWYLNLPKVQDKVGSPESIKALQEALPAKPQLVRSKPAQKPKVQFSRHHTSKIVAIEEVEDSDEDEDEDEDEDLIPYEKPDDDAYDSDDDPTLIQRNKPTAPVYIRDLIPSLRDTENVERYHLAITTAPSLIRRKIGFGTELSEQIEELALTIVGFQNDNNHPTFHESRLQSMIALIVSQPLKMGRWFTAIYFDGDLSQVQRSAVLTALGLSARELAGNGEADAKALRLPTTGDTSFPSKRLSPALEAMYSGANESPIATLTQKMSRASLEPLAADAADTMAGPNALKVRTFSSRMEVEKKRNQRDAQRQSSTIKDLHKVLAEGFFFPLQGRFEIIMLQFSSSSTSSYNPFFIPHLLTLFLQTLSLILSTTGPNTPFLPGLTHETLSLLLALHTASISSEPTVTAALLSLFLAVVDLNIGSGSNGEQRLVTEYATQVIELREWASQVFDRTPPSAARADPSSAVIDPQEQIRTLSAGVMVRLGEVIERYQGRLMGVHSGFSY
ncbi:uncharacterized protein N7479_008062 [Penicillium vulpinum]|uniref:Telomere length regulation protein conserved domain-containing protein n=1 Tax=Penicillium vulpinum TaxID=29845 RepID=A0A1V6RCX3_9EURO|nr:uncharacterized protein N7479_008062 [Penicillium vulpinum]KAJ5960912.1 hypothetical protein N7479_008062 [Penicillium vulpinum]OQD99032.1 hypothetical protein PENVUL_c066G08165 [Penicillium vulpinum]